MPTIQARALGSRNSLLEDWAIAFPPEWAEGSDNPLRLRNLIERLVRAEVDAVRSRIRRERIFVRLTAARIEEMAAGGRVVGGDGGPCPSVNLEKAVGEAFRAFENGLYLVFIDGEPCDGLDQCIDLRAESTVVFLRVTPLVGG